MTTTMMMLALEGAAILTAAALASVLLARAPASLRHLVWTAALAAVLVLPVVEASGLRIEIPVPGAWMGGAAAPDERARDVRSVPSRAAAIATQTERPERVTSIGRGVSATTASGPAPRLRAARSLPSAGPSAGLTDEIRGAATARPALDATVDATTLPTLDTAVDATALPTLNTAALAATIWAAGALALLSLVVVGQVRAWLFTVRDVRPAGPATQARLDRLARGVGVERPVRGLVSRKLRVPATWGFLRSAIVLPEEHVVWTTAMLDRVLLHELAHIRRRDCATQLLGELVRSLHWPNPLAWIATRRQRVESERACDDRVLAQGEVASAYATDLVVLARTLKSAARPPRAALAVTDSEGVGARVRAILEPGLARGEVGRAAGATVAALAVAAALSLAGFVPVAEAQEWTLPEPPAPPAAAAPMLPPSALPAVGVVAAPIAELPPLPLRAFEPAAPSAAPAAPGPYTRPFYEALWTGPAPAPAPTGAFRAVGVGARAVAPAPAPTQELCVFGQSERRSSNYNIDDDDIRVRIETDRCRLEIEVEGDVRFAADDSGIATMGDGALFEMEERIGRDTRRARLEGRGGEIERRYWVDGDEAPWSEEADRWIAQILPELFRNTTIDAPARVERLLEGGGPDAVFAEVQRMRSDHVAATYLRLMVDRGELSESDYARVIDHAARIESDHQSAQLLTTVVQRAGLRPSFQEPMLRAAASIDSDHQMAQVLQTILSSDGLSPEQLDAVVRAAQGIDSDHQLAGVLSTVASRRGLDDAGRAAFMETLGSIDSDHQLASVLDTFLDAGPLTAEELSQVLGMMRAIESDHQKATILQRIAREYPLAGDEVTVYLRAASDIDSDHQLAATAAEIIDRAEFTSEQLQLVLVLADDLGSDHQRGTVLLRVIERRTLDPREVRLVLGVAAGISSDHQLSGVLSAMAADQDLEAEGVNDVLAVAGEISSDHSLAGVLTTLAERYAIEGDALIRYRALAERMSDHQRDRALAALVGTRR